MFLGTLLTVPDIRSALGVLGRLLLACLYIAFPRLPYCRTALGVLGSPLRRRTILYFSGILPHVRPLEFLVVLSLDHATFSFSGILLLVPLQ